MAYPLKTIIGVIYMANIVGIVRMEIFRTGLVTATTQPLLDNSLRPALKTWFMVIVTVVA